MVTVILTHEVKNFQEWKIGFDADEPQRANAGVKTNGLYTSVVNPNMVTIIFDFPSTDAFDGFMARPDLSEKMKEAGVISRPEALVLKRR